MFSTGTEFKATGCPGARLASTEKLNHFPYRACELSDVQDLIRITSSALSRLVCVWVFKRGLFTVCQVWEASSSGASGLHTCIFKDILSTAAKEVYNTWRQLSVHLNSSCSAGAGLQESHDLKSSIFAHRCSILSPVCFGPISWAVTNDSRAAGKWHHDSIDWAVTCRAIILLTLVFISIVFSIYLFFFSWVFDN